MTKRERVTAALGRKTVDRAPVSFWRHAPDVDHTARGLAGAMLDFQRRWDLDFIKVMSSGVYCVEDWGCKVAYTGAPSGAKQCVQHAVARAADWARLRPLDPGAGALGRELEALQLIVAGKSDDAPLLHTHGKNIYFDELAALPAHALNWHDRVTPPTLAEGQRRFPGAVIGGLSEWQTLRQGPAAAVAAEAEDAIRQTGGVGLMVAPGCGLPLDVPDAHLEAAVSAVKGSGA